MGRKRTKAYEVLRFIEQFLLENCRFPTYREIADAFTFSDTRTAWVHIHWLVENGYLTRDHKGRLRHPDARVIFT